MKTLIDMYVHSIVCKGKKEIEFDMDYGILEEVAAGKAVFIDYMNGVMPQIRIKYMRGEKSLIHLASHR